ncbi:MAG: hypothetical protein IIX99_00185 [Oscillospiraceae bacterium]|nr:hypothetical protein [Oscillospiraceae bacterium]
MPVNYAQQYARELANAYPYLSYFADLWGQGEARRFRPLNGKTVMIPSMTVTGATAVNREQITGVFNRNFNVEWQACQLGQDREWSTLVDPMDIVETNEVATIANVTRTFNEQQKVPEMDAYAASKLAGYASSFGGTDTSSLTSATILGLWDTYLAYMTNARINRDRVECKMTPATYKLLKEAAGITRFVDVATGIRDYDRNVGRLDGVRIIEVPEDMMKTAYDFTTGWAIGGSAAQIDMLFYAPDSVAAPIVYDTSMMSAPTAQSKGRWLYYERYYYDLFALNQRGAGIFAHLSSAASLGTLTVTSVAGSASGATIINATGYGIGQNGHAFDGLEMYITSGNNSAPSVSYGSALPGGVTWTKVSGVPQTLTSQTAGKYVTVALVNAQTGYAVAAGSATEVVGA